jgi:hypothetical protein
VLFRGEAADVHADFGQNDQSRSYVDSLDFCQVHAQCPEQRAGRLEPDVIGWAFGSATVRDQGASASESNVYMYGAVLQEGPGYGSHRILSRRFILALMEIKSARIVRAR